MKGAKVTPATVVDRYTRGCLTAIAILLTVLIIGLWATGPAGPSPSSAAPPPALGANPPDLGNPLAQRIALIQAVQTTNQKLDKIIDLLERGRIKVVVVEEKPKNVRPKPQKPL